MFPNVTSAFLNWTSSVQMKVISKSAVDFELQEGTVAVVTFEAVIEAMKSKDVERKPENERLWKWWDMWTTTKVEADSVIQDPDGVQFRVQKVNDWGQGGFYICELTEQPVNLDQP